LLLLLLLLLLLFWSFFASVNVINNYLNAFSGQLLVAFPTVATRIVVAFRLIIKISIL
jgi:hypothetical protein